MPTHTFIALHQVGGPGVLEPEDVESNERAIKNGSRVFSAFEFTPEANDSIKIWIITEADRSSTTILLPSEY